MSASDPGDRALVAQERVELAPIAFEDLAQCCGVELECVGPEVPEVLSELLSGDEPNARPLLLARLGEDELTAVGEAQAEHRRLRALRPGRDVAQPARAHQMYAQHEIRILDREQEVLAAASRTFEAPTVELGERRRERLQRRDVRGSRLLDRRAGHERVELPHPRFDLR